MTRTRAQWCLVDLVVCCGLLLGTGAFPEPVPAVASHPAEVGRSHIRRAVTPSVPEGRSDMPLVDFGEMSGDESEDIGEIVSGSVSKHGVLSDLTVERRGKKTGRDPIPEEFDFIAERSDLCPMRFDGRTTPPPEPDTHELQHYSKVLDKLTKYYDASLTKVVLHWPQRPDVEDPDPAEEVEFQASKKQAAVLHEVLKKYRIQLVNLHENKDDNRIVWEKGAILTLEEVKEESATTLVFSRVRKGPSDLKLEGVDAVWIWSALDEECLSRGFEVYWQLFSQGAKEALVDSTQESEDILAVDSFVDWEQARRFTVALPLAFKRDIETPSIAFMKKLAKIRKLDYSENYGDLLQSLMKTWTQLLQLLFVYTRHLPWEGLKAQMKAVAAEARQGMGPADTVLMLGERGHQKSNCWLAQLVEEEFKVEGPRVLYVPLHQNPEEGVDQAWNYIEMFSAVGADATTSLFLVDDASFSGAQMAGIVENAVKAVADCRSNGRCKGKYILKVRVMGATGQATYLIDRAYARAIQFNFLGNNALLPLDFKSGSSLYSLEELFSDLFLDLMNTDSVIGHFKILGSSPNGHSLVTSDWKVIDAVSMPIGYITGILGTTVRVSQKATEIEFDNGMVARSSKSDDYTRFSFFSQDALYRQHRFLPCMCPPYKLDKSCDVPSGLIPKVRDPHAIKPKLLSQQIGCPGYDSRVGYPRMNQLKRLKLATNPCEEVTAMYYHSTDIDWKLVEPRLKDSCQLLEDIGCVLGKTTDEERTTVCVKDEQHDKESEEDSGHFRYNADESAGSDDDASAGVDSVIGHGGTDRFVFHGADSADTVSRFEPEGYGHHFYFGAGSDSDDADADTGADSDAGNTGVHRHRGSAKPVFSGYPA